MKLLEVEGATCLSATEPATTRNQRTRKSGFQSKNTFVLNRQASRYRNELKNLEINTSNIVQ